jgi:hypothetical protein
MLASSPASILNHNRRLWGILRDSLSVDYALAPLMGPTPAADDLYVSPARDS